MILTVHFAVRCLSIWNVAAKRVMKLVEVKHFSACVFKVVDLVVLVGDEVLNSVVHLLVGKCAREVDKERLELRTELTFTWFEELSLNFGLQSDPLE